MSRTLRRVIIALALVGFAAAAASAWVHYRIAHDPAYVSFCDVNATVSCRDVYQSRFGSVGGIPVAVFGAFWFGLVALLTVAAGRGSAELARSVGGYLLVLSTVGLAAILFLAYESFFVLGTLCLLCVTAHVAVVGIFPGREHHRGRAAGVHPGSPARRRGAARQNAGGPGVSPAVTWR